MFDSKYPMNQALYGKAAKAFTDTFKGLFKWIKFNPYCQLQPTLYSTHYVEMDKLECLESLFPSKYFIFADCGQNIFSPITHKCCCGDIYAIKQNWSCCGYRYYDTKAQKCCSFATLLHRQKTCPRSEV